MSLKSMIKENSKWIAIIIIVIGLLLAYSHFLYCDAPKDTKKCGLSGIDNKTILIILGASIISFASLILYSLYLLNGIEGKWSLSLLFFIILVVISILLFILAVLYSMYFLPVSIVVLIFGLYCQHYPEKLKVLFFIILLLFIFGGLVITFLYESAKIPGTERSFEWIGAPLFLIGTIVFFAIGIKESNLKPNQNTNNNDSESVHNRDRWLTVLQIFSFVLLSVLLAYFTYQTSEANDAMYKLERIRDYAYVIAIGENNNITLINEGKIGATCFCKTSPEENVTIPAGREKNITCCGNNEDLICKNIRKDRGIFVNGKPGEAGTGIAHITMGEIKC